MTYMGEEAALAALKAAFAKFAAGVNDRDQLDNLARDVRSGAKRGQSLTLPAGINETQRRYLEAVHENAVAELRYAQAVQEARNDMDTTRAQSQCTQTSLYSHLDSLRQERLNRHLTVIGNYVNEVDGLQEDLTTPPIPEVVLEDDLAHANTTYSHIDDLIVRLEFGILEADSAAKAQSLRLQRAQDAMATDNIDNSMKLRALNAVRNELTAWLEESLAICAAQELENEVLDPKDLLSSAMVQETYDDYIIARRNLLQALSTLTPRVRPKQRAPTGSTMPTAVSPAFSDTALERERQHHSQQAQTTLQQLRRHASSELNEEQNKSLLALLRLAEESQLLLQYPILSKTDRFGKLASQLGGMSNVEESKVTEQVSGWAFAAEAANTTTTTSLQTHLREAEAALGQFNDALNELKLLRMTICLLGS